MTFLVSGIEWEGTDDYLGLPPGSKDAAFVGRVLDAELYVDANAVMAFPLKISKSEEEGTRRQFQLLGSGVPFCAFRGVISDIREDEFPSDDPVLGGQKRLLALLQTPILLPMIGVFDVHAKPFPLGSLLEGISLLQANVIQPRTQYGITYRVRIRSVKTLTPFVIDALPFTYRIVTGTIDDVL